RELTIHGRLATDHEELWPEEEWTRHASGILSSTSAPEPSALTVWPPEGATEAVPVEGFYTGLAESGYGYGPAFQGLRAAWRQGDTVFAEVQLPEAVREEAGSYTIHPALLDAACQALGFVTDGSGDSAVKMPFAWSGVSVHASGASELRVRLTRTGPETVTFAVADTTGRPVASVGSLVMRPVAAGVPRLTRDGLHEVVWDELLDAPAAFATECAVIGDADAAALLGAQAYPDLASLGEAVPPLVVAVVDGNGTRAALEQALGWVQGWMAEERFAGSRLAVVTRGAVAVGTGEVPTDEAGAAVAGLVKSAESENPGRFLLADVDGTAESWRALPTLGDGDEPQIALRYGRAYVPRLVRAGEAGGSLQPPAGTDAWRLEIGEAGSLDGLRLAPAEDAQAALLPGQVRIAVRAAGLNFRDVLGALGMYPGGLDLLGNEIAGEVVETGEGVTGLAVGDRVMGLVAGGLGPMVVAEGWRVVRMPRGWTFTRAAGVPVAFLTALYGLRELGGLAAGQRVLVHAAAGGVGTAAVQVARLLGAEVYATASAPKQEYVADLGVDRTRIASSRTLDFASSFPEVDVVLNSLAGEYVDASLGLLREGGRFVEMGKTDVRDAAAYDGVTYRTFDLGQAGPELIARMLGELVEWFEAGELTPVRTVACDVRRAVSAFRWMSQARHVGKIVLTVPRALDADGTVLITGGTGTLGGLLARHLVTEHGVRHLLLVSRTGEQAALRRELEELGAEVRIVACDIADRAAVAELLDGIPPEHSLTGVFHAAGVLDDGVVTGLDSARLARVLAPKVDGALHLHELTAEVDLSAFVLFSSMSGLLGASGQAGYAAANMFLDALAQQRRAQGLPGLSLAWGLWESASAMTAHLSDTDLRRMGGAGMRGLTRDEGMELLDAAWQSGEALLAPVRWDHRLLRRLASSGARVPSLLRKLVRAPRRRTVLESAKDGGLRERLSTLSEAERRGVLNELVAGSVAAVLGHVGTDAVPVDRPFKELGFDSLTSVEFRNRLNEATGLRLPSTLVFDHPTPSALAARLDALLPGAETATTAAAPASLHEELDRLEAVLLSPALDGAERDGLAARLRTLASRLGEPAGPADGRTVADRVQSATDDELFALLDGRFENP
ncbi:SDR family NAD(P)-dependent oxidoreductase, partial [Streptomyces sp. NPDC021212]|uniref:SDR family NAD(P)-dependent oxidoreductase n=1 Tax=Streptomyces sp. NPDC021212 TaxID=3365118 RepID=UPI00378F6332